MRERDVLKYSCLFCADKGLNVECKIVKFLRKVPIDDSLECNPRGSETLWDQYP